MKMRIIKIAQGWMCLAAMLAVIGSAKADSVTFTGTSGSRSASATFEVVGNNLVITLVNTSLSDAAAPTDILTALFFDDGTHVFGKVSAVVAPGSSVLFGGTDPGGVVGGEWAYASGLTGTPGNSALGVSSSGLGLFGPANVFPGSNLQGPADPDGVQYGITSAGDNPTTGNQAVTGSNALIKNAVVFTMSMDAPFTLDSLNIHNVSFQYGTALGEPNIPGTPDGGTTIALLGFAFVSIGAIRRKITAK